MSNDRVEFVPWYNKKEFQKVYEYAYESELTKKRWAVDQISLWKTRDAALPTGVEATYALQRAVIQDILLMHNATLCQAPDISMMYASALVRFVNLIVESPENKKKNLNPTNIKKIHLSIIKKAKLRGVPDWIVNLRHDVSHANFPSLAMLRNGVASSLAWLKTNFWEVEMDSFSDKIGLCCQSPGLEIITTVEEYIKTVQLCRKGMPQKQKNLLIGKQAKTMKRIKVLMAKHETMFFKVMLCPSIFFPTSEQLKEMLNENEQKFIKDMTQEVPTTLKLPDTLINLWEPFFSVVQDLKLVNHFLVALLEKQSEYKDCDWYLKLIVAWALNILNLAIFNGMTKSECSLFHDAPTIHLKWFQIVKAALIHPCKYIPSLVPLISVNLSKNEKLVSHLMYLVAIKLGQAISDKNVPVINVGNLEESLFTAESLKRAVIYDEASRKENKCIEKETWEFVESSDIDFSNVPMAVILGEKDGDDDDEEEETVEMEEEIPMEEETTSHIIEAEYEQNFILVNNEEDIANEENIELENSTDNIDCPQDKYKSLNSIYFLYC